LKEELKDINKSVNKVETPVRHTSASRLKWLFGILSILIALGVGITHFTGYLAGKIVSNQVEKYSKYTYTIDFKEVKIDWAKSQIDLIGFEYRQLDSTAVLENHIRYSAKSAQLKLESIFGVYFEQALHVEHFVVNSPVVKINQVVRKEKKQNFSFKTGNLYKEIQGFVKSFQIDEFEVRNLNLDFQQSYDLNGVHYQVNDLSFTIHNFKIDSTAAAQNNGFFFTEFVDLTIKNQFIDVGDGMHQIWFDSMYLSTATRNIEVFNLTIDTIGQTNKSRLNERFNTYQLEVPYCGIRGLDFLKAYQSNVLAVDSMVFNDLMIRSSLGSLKKKGSQVELDTAISNSVLNLLFQVFDRYELGQFEINDTKVDILLENAQDSIKIEGLDFEFAGFVLDSSALKLEYYYPTFEGLNFKVSHPNFGLPNGDKLSANQLNFSTYDSSLIISDVDLFSDKINGRKGNSVHINAIEMYGVKPKDIIQNGEISIAKLNILKPDIKIFKMVQQNEQFNIDLHSFIEGAITNYSIRELNILNGSVRLKTPNSTFENIHLRLDDFQLNEQSLKKAKFLYANRVRLNLRNIAVQLPNAAHKLDIAQLKLDSRAGLVEVLNWELSPSVLDSSNIRFLSETTGEHVLIKGVDFDHVTDMEQIQLNQVTVDGVHAKVNIITSDSVNFDTVNIGRDFLKKLTRIQLNNMDLVNLDVLVQRDGASVAKWSKGYFNIKELVSDSSSLAKGNLVMEGDSASFGLDRLILPLPKMYHVLNVESVRKSADAKIAFGGISLRPAIGVSVPDTLPRIVAYIPLISSQYFQALGKENLDTLTLGELNLLNPNIKLTLPKEKSSRSNSFELPEKLPVDFVDDVFKMLKLEGINVSDGKFQLIHNQTKFVVNRLNLKSKDWMISKTSTWDPKRFLYAADFELSLQKIDLDLPGHKFCHHLDSLEYRFKPNALNIHGIYFNNTTSKKVKTGAEMSFYLPFIRMSEVDIYQYLTDSSLVIDKIESHNGLLDADLFGNTSDTGTIFSIPKIVPDLAGFKNVKIHEFEVDKMDVQLRRHQNGRVSPLEMDHFSLKVDSFHVYPGEELDTARVLWADNIEMSVKNVYSTIDEGLYEIGADQLSFSTQKDSIGLARLSFVPTVPRMEYALHKGGYTTDVFNVYLRNLHLTDFRFDRLVYDHVIEGGELLLNKPSVSVFKDKRNNVPPVKYKEILPEIFKKAPVKISFDSVLVNDMNIRYDEFPATGREPGHLVLTHTQIKVTNLTNDTAKLEIDSTLLIDMNSQFLDAGQLQLNLEYNMLSPINNFIMSSSLGSIDGTLINTFIEPTYSARINSCEVNKMTMLVIGNDSIAGGKMGLYYEDLKFELLNQEDQHAKKLITWIGNKVVATKNRYHYFKKPKDIFYVRDTAKGWINYLVKLELQGVQANTRLKTNQGKSAKNASPELWAEFEADYKKNLKKLGKKEKKKDKVSKKAAKKKN
jgi:hypothetical protein